MIQRGDKLQLGRLGERVAAYYLRNKGFGIVACNYRNSIGEIDIIAIDRDKQELIFCEVKTRTSDRFGSPLEAVDARKRDKITKVAQLFLQNSNYDPSASVRFDVLGLLVDFTSQEAEIEHIKNAFI